MKLGICHNPTLIIRSSQIIISQDRLMLIGHSAGGCLALWAAHHLAAESGAERAAPLVLAAAPVADLVKGFEMKVSDEGRQMDITWYHYMMYIIIYTVYIYIIYIYNNYTSIMYTYGGCFHLQSESFFKALPPQAPRMEVMLWSSTWSSRPPLM